MRSAVQVDHVPPIAVFTLRRRPEGLEFSTCAECHKGTRALDAVAGFYSRLFPEPVDEAGRQEGLKLYRGMINAVPEIGMEHVIGSMLPVDRSNAELMTKALGPGEHRNLFGPIARSYMDRFGARVALALHYQETGVPLPTSGKVHVRTMTNTALTRGDLPEGMLEDMGGFRALMQKGLKSEDDFAFATVRGRDDTETLTFFRLRKSMGAIAFCFTNDPGDESPNLTTFSPGFLAAESSHRSR